MAKQLPPRLKVQWKTLNNENDKYDVIQIFDIVCPNCGLIAKSLKSPKNVFQGRPILSPAETLCAKCISQQP